MFLGALIYFMLVGSERLGLTEVLCFVDLDAAVGTDKLRVLIQLIDLCAGFSRLHLAHMQFAVFLGV